jgi:hypothetical protein
MLHFCLAQARGQRADPFGGRAIQLDKQSIHGHDGISFVKCAQGG